MQPIVVSYLRFSSAAQREGDSVRRQTALAEDYCARHGLKLDTRLKLRDEGVSGFKGAHRENPDRHALAGFLDTVKSGRVPRGSTLLVENCDRLSREDILPALELFLSILRHGIVIVQLVPECRFDPDNLDPMRLMMA